MGSQGLAGDEEKGTKRERECHVTSEHLGLRFRDNASRAKIMLDFHFFEITDFETFLSYR